MRELRADFADVEEVREALQFAVELEFATIPPYLCALWSIKDRRSPAALLIAGVVVEEMLHMALAANILNAIGGRPALTSSGAVPTYPGPLPGNVQAGLVVGLRRCDAAQLEIFKRIETPEKPVDVQPAGRRAAPATIGQFYDGIGLAIEDLGPPIFTGDPGRQVRGWSMGGALRGIESPADARWAISLIKEQGEGVSAHDPNDREGELAHYYQFWEIIEGREIVLDGDGWAFSGRPIPMPETFPVADDPKVDDQRRGSGAWLRTLEFNATYRNLMQALEQTFDGSPATFPSALGLMYSLEVQARDLYLHPSGRGDATVAGPTFEYHDATATGD